MEKKNNAITITLNEEDKVLYDFLIDQGVFDLDIDDEEEEMIEGEKNIKSVLKKAVQSYQSYIDPQYSVNYSHISPKALKEVVENKSREELLGIKQLFIDELVRLTKIFNDNAGVEPDYYEPDKFWNVKTESAIGHITLYSNYISVIDELLHGGKNKESKDLNGLVKTVCMKDEVNGGLLEVFPEYTNRVLSEEETKVINLRYGLLSGKALTLLEVSKELGITREKVRQIEDKALFKLKQGLVNTKIVIDKNGHIKLN